MDLSKFTDSDLDALESGDLSKLSDKGFSYLESQYTNDKPARPETVVPKWGRENPNLYGVVGAARETLGLPMEMAGSVAGATIGSGLGPAGTVAGGTLGYAIPKGFNRYLDNLLGNQEAGTLLPTATESFSGDIDRYSPMIQEALKSVRDVEEGLQFEGAGRLVIGTGGKVIGAGKRFYDRSTGKLIDRELKELAAERAGDAYVPRGDVNNARVTKEVGEATQRLGVDDDLLTIGQKTGDLRVRSAEKVALDNPDNAYGMLEKEALAMQQADEGVAAAMNGGKLPDTERALASLKKALQDAYELSESQVDDVIARFEAGSSNQETGIAIREALREAKGVKRAEVSGKFDRLPDTDINTQGLLDEIELIKKEVISEGIDPAQAPNAQMSQIRKSAPPDEVPLTLNERYLGASPKPTADPTMMNQKLRGIRSQLGLVVRENPDTSKARYAQRLIAKIDEAFASSGDEAFQAAYNEARDGWKTYVKTFREGETGKVLKYINPTPEQVIPSAFLGAGKAQQTDQFIASFNGDINAAREHARQFYYSQLKNINTGNKFGSWFGKNREQLRKLGLEDEFKGFNNALRGREEAHEAVKVFEKSVLAKLLNADPDRAVGTIFNAANPKQAMQEVIKSLDGNEAAINGLQSGYFDFLRATSRTAVKNPSGRTTESYAALSRSFAKHEQALKVLFKSQPQKLQAVKDFIRLNEAVASNKAVKSTVGSDTYANLVQAGKGGADKKETIVALMRVGAVLKGFGWGLHAVESLVKNILKSAEIIKVPSEEAISMIISEARYNPELASELAMLMKGKAHNITPGFLKTYMLGAEKPISHNIGKAMLLIAGEKKRKTDADTGIAP